MRPHVADPAGALRSTLDRSDVVDNAFGFRCRANKCAVVVLENDCSLDQLIRERGYLRTDSLELLGVVLDLQDGSTSLPKLSVQTLLLRLRYLRILGPSTLKP